MKHVARTFIYALVAVSSYPEKASAQLAPGDPATGFTLGDWVTGVTGATDIEFMPDGRGVITRKSGQVVVVDRDGNFMKNPAFTFTGVDASSEKGLLGVARDDNDNLYFYVSNGPSNADKHRVYKAQIAADGTVTVNLENPIVSGGLEGPANHDGGGMVVHKGQLYIGVGDTGANDTPPRNMYGACLNRANGKILRVNLDGSIPEDNPLVNREVVTGCSARVGVNYEMLPPDKRIYAWGFRNPWRFWIDPRTDLLWIGDVGETSQEEITVGGLGSNHGWPFNEGTRNYPVPLGGLNACSAMTPATDCTAPQDTYAHDGSQASVTGGLVPSEGCGWGAYEKKYFFADYNRNLVWTIDLKPDRSGAVPGSRALFATVAARSGLVSFRMGPDGAMYLVGHQAAAIKRIAPNSVPATCNAAQPPPGGSGGGGGGSGGDGTAVTGGTGTAPVPAPGTDSGGCSCSFSPRSSRAATLGLILFLGAAIARRRRR
jgi:glucose/arabinose dehydrogenase